MSTATMISAIDQIGETAGEVWQCLDLQESMSMAQLIKSIDAPRDVTMQAVGWLAREDKVEIDETTRGRQIRLK
ncbi:MAG: winged helix-turn-helix domain-containing protein [Pirellulaceae bacterium]|jgi:hypothetical protein|nr:winged helix-turn-helix domain-containing protein [Pirellulaceae bacterium]MDP7302987.1 winged helix-turn-helix domain-containing protein [Pirellulaceae bacterium]HJN07929.1 winged helix-turn-helix domain-containing protein [Pirellulaceae bacterium]